MPIGLVVLSSCTSVLWTAAVSGGTSPGAHGDLVRVELAEVVVEPSDVGDVLLGRVAVLAGLDVDDPDALAEVGEGHAARLHDEVVLGLAAVQHVAAGRGADGVFHHVRRDAHDVGLAVHAAAAVLEDVERLVVLHEDTGALEDLERGEVDLLEFGRR